MAELRSTYRPLSIRRESLRPEKGEKEKDLKRKKTKLKIHTQHEKINRLFKYLSLDRLDEKRPLKNDSNLF